MKAISNIKTFIPIIRKGLDVARKQGVKEHEEFKAGLLNQSLPIFDNNHSLAHEYVEIITNESLSIDEISVKLLKINV